MNPDPPLVTPSPRTFQYSKHPAKELVNYIKRPLCSTAQKEGYIYTFQLEADCNLNKIGYTTQGKNDDTLKDSLARRMSEHKSCGWPEPKCVLEIQVPHAQRVEQIIGKHLGYRRVEECNMTNGLNGKTCKHKIHREWFKVSLDVIHEIVRAWHRWITTNPYVETNGVYKLSSEWKLRLEEVLKIDPEGKDYWLEWLRRFVPPDDSFVKIGMQVTNISASEDLDGNKISSIITTTVEVLSGEHDGETPHSPKITLRRRDTFIKRLICAKTWPKVA